VLSLRMRQVLEFVNDAGQVLPSLNGESVWIDFERGGLPVLLDLTGAFNINKTRSLYPKTRGLPKPGHQLQLGALLHGSDRAWIKSFGDGLEDLQQHLKQWNFDVLTKKEQEKQKKGEFVTHAKRERDPFDALS